MAARKLTAKERRELPARAFGIPSQRKYPVMVLGRNGKPAPSKSHARDAKSRAKEGLEKGWVDRRQYTQIVAKADRVLKGAETRTASAIAKSRGQSVTLRKAPTRRRRRNPSEIDHERIGVKALDNSEEYWRGYIDSGRTDTKLLVDSYKFLVIAHEELKYGGKSEPRLRADHMLKNAHKELSRMLK